jgi:uncharacterized surface protein with fasciclin (FAS1) repeats
VAIFPVRKHFAEDNVMLKKLFLGLGLIAAMGVQSAQAGCGTCDKSIVENAVATEDFSTLVAAVKAAGLVETLSGEGPFTVFAPTNAAFAKLPEGTLDTLLQPENKGKLTSILTYHVVPGAVMAKDVVNLSEAKTVQGDKIDIKVEGGNVMVDGAKVIKTDIACKNGVIHVIDAVITPGE